MPRASICAILIAFLFLTVTLSVLPVEQIEDISSDTPPTSTRYSGGDGTTRDPYQIVTASDLQNMNNDLDAHYILMNDIDLNSVFFSPIGYAGNSFEGTLDGQNFNITNLAISSFGSAQGLFGYVYDATIQNLNVINANVDGVDHIGLLAGSTSESTIKYVTTSGSVTLDRHYGGGLIGEATNCKILNSSSTASVTIDHTQDIEYIGGLIGKVYSCTIMNCYSTGDVWTSSDGTSASDGEGESVGGLIGWAKFSTIVSTNATGDVYLHMDGDSPYAQSVGGLVGRLSRSVLLNSFATGDVEGSSDSESNVGGLIGSSEQNVIKNTYATGSATGQLYVGGLVGSSIGPDVNTYDNIDNSYSTGSVTGTSNFGGLVGYSFRSNVTNCFWDTQTSGQAASAGGTGQTTAQMQTVSTFTNAGWDYTNVWMQNTNEYPRFGWLEISYIIHNLNELDNMRYNMYGYFTLANDIDASATHGWNGGDGFDPIGILSYRFSGSLDGQGYSIYNFTSDRSTEDYVGLFGLITDKAVISNLNMVNYTSVGKFSVGSITGWGQGTIINCHSYGNSTGTSWVGGMVGSNGCTISDSSTKCDVTGTGSFIGSFVGFNDGSINRCYALGNATGKDNTSAFAGINRGFINNSFSHGNATGMDEVGGFVGNNSGEIINSYSTGKVTGSTRIGGFAGNSTGTITYCFWDNITSEMTTSDGGTGMITSELMKLYTFLSVGWDFWDCWNIEEGSSYPYLGPFQFPGGSGTPADPYWITNVVELQGMITDLTAYYIVTNDIDASSVSWWNFGIGFEPIRNEHHGFYGSLEGQGYKVTDLMINRPSEDNIALISSPMGGSSFVNLTLENVNFTGKAKVGGLAAISNGAEYLDCQISGILNGSQIIGGLIAESNQDVINDCHTDVEVTAVGQRAAGFIGYANRGMIYDSSSAGNVTGNVYSGGFSGYSHTTTFMRCNASANVIGVSSPADLGGFVGRTIDCVVYHCNSYGTVDGFEDVGGLIGEASGPHAIYNCTSSGDVNGSMNIGGFVGQNSNYIQDSTASGNVTASGHNSGGFIGRNWATVKYSSASGDVDGNRYTGGFAGRSNALIDDCFSTGNVKTTEYYSGGFCGYANSQIQYSYSNGDIVGNDHIGGFVGYVNENVHVTECYSTGSVVGDEIVGGFAGWMNGRVYRSFSTGNVTGIDFVGGFAGAHANSNFMGTGYEGRIYDSYSTGSVNGTGYFVGGFAGSTGTFLTAWVYRCYSIGKLVKPNSYAGGFAGTSGPTYDFGCFWDNETTGVKSCTIGSGRNTTDMQTISTFTDEGWNFDTTWNISENHTYPYLRWETNYAPRIVTSGMDSIDEDTLYTMDFNSYDHNPTDTRPEWKLSTNADWLSIDNRGLVNGIPENKDVGDYWVEVSVYDGRGGSNSTNYTLTVRNVNDPPEITNGDVVFIDEDTLYSVSYEALDIDPVGDTLTWNLNTNADWLALVGSDLTGTPENEDVGTYWINVSVDDGVGGIDWTNFTLQVNNTNDDPEIQTIPLESVDEDSQYSEYFFATDVDPTNDMMLWELTTNAPWLEMTYNHLQGIPENSDVGSWWANVTVADGNGGSDFLNFTIQVNNTNDLPVWTKTPSDQVITEGDPINLTCSAYDEDGDDITYSLNITPTANIAIDLETGVIRWLNTIPGTYNTELAADDGIISIYYDFTIVVLEKPDDSKPEDNQTNPDNNQTVSEPGPNSTTDTDQDGIPDWWEEFYGLDPNDPSDAGDDPDSDGTTNLKEYTARTSPTKDNRIPDDGTDGGSTDGGGGNGADGGDGGNGDGATTSDSMGYIATIVILVILLIAAIAGAVFFMMKGKGEEKGEEPEEEEEELDEEEELPDEDDEPEEDIDPDNEVEEEGDLEDELDDPIDPDDELEGSEPSDEGPDLEELDRRQLKALIKENELDIKITKKLSDEDIRQRIREL